MVTTQPNHQLSLEVAPTFSELAGVRARFGCWLADEGVPAAVRDDLTLVVTELCTNAIEATAPGSRVSVAARHDGAAVHLRVTNDGEADGPLVAPSLAPGSLQERGRGLAIVTALTDSVSMTSAEGRTVVHTTRLL